MGEGAVYPAHEWMLQCGKDVNKGGPLQQQTLILAIDAIVKIPTVQFSTAL